MNPVPLRASLLVLALLLAVGCGESVEPVKSTSPAASPADPSSAAEPAAPPGQSEPYSPSLPIEPDDFQPEDGFVALSVDDFRPFQGGDDTWQEVDGVIVCSGEPKGYIHSVQSYGNFTWRAEYRFAPVADETKRPLANTGFMIHIQPEHKIWPRSLEVQGRWDEMCSIKSNGGVPDLVIEDDPAARESAREPVGEWNAVEIISRDGALSSTLNGTPICSSEAGELKEGMIGLQSEMFETHFRRLRIRIDE